MRFRAMSALQKVAPQFGLKCLIINGEGGIIADVVGLCILAALGGRAYARGSRTEVLIPTGEGGIRTHDGREAHSGFQDRRGCLFMRLGA